VDKWTSRGLPFKRCSCEGNAWSFRRCVLWGPGELGARCARSGGSQPMAHHQVLGRSDHLTYAHSKHGHDWLCHCHDLYEEECRFPPFQVSQCSSQHVIVAALPDEGFQE
jgi:hypothetical protein